MNSNYRTYDYSANIILNSKVSTYGPYRSVKQKNNTSNKKIQPLHIKMFDRPKKNQRVLSRNDRMDLFLQGGNFSQTRQTTSKSQVERSFYKISRMKKKQQIFSPNRSQARTNGWQGLSNYNTNFNNNQSNQPNADNQNLAKSDYISIVHTSDESRKQNQIKNQISQTNQQTNIVHQKSFDHVNVKTHNLTTRNKKPLKNGQQQIIHHVQTNFINPKINITKHGYNSFNIKSQEMKTTYKNMVQKQKFAMLTKNSFNSENQLQKTNKIKRPLFYLQPKQIGHIRADSFIVTQYPSGQIIFGNYFKKNGEIASLTKIMTFYTVYSIANKFSKNVSEQIVEIDQQAQSVTGTSAQIFVGDTYTIQQLFYGLMLPSGNDAATALAKWGGSILQKNDPNYKTDIKNNEVKTFIKYMNVMAKNCGMKASKFCNPHGLPHPQSSSNAQDLSCLMSECLKIDLFREVIRTKKFQCWVDHKGTKHEVIWQNTNKLLRRTNFIGGKTGVTVTAGPCLASCYQLPQKILIIILLRTNKLSRRFKQTRMILALALSKLDKNLYKERIREVQRNDPDLDSDNSDDELQFNYQRNDAKEMTKRNKILTFQM